MRSIGLPEVFLFETLDLYEKKNVPKVIYCIHALSHLLAKLGLAPHIKNLVGKLQFTDEQLDATAQSLDEAGVPMPQFGGIAHALAAELPPVSREEYLAENVHKIVKCQAQVRMHLARKKRLARIKYWKDNERSIVIAQAHYRGIVARRAYRERINRFKANEHLFVKVCKSILIEFRFKRNGVEFWPVANSTNGNNSTRTTCKQSLRFNLNGKHVT